MALSHFVHKIGRLGVIFGSLATQTPVCQGSRKDCRQNTETNLVHCRASEANPIGWLYRGTDSLGFGLWANQTDCEE